MKRARSSSWDGSVSLEPREGQLWHIATSGEEIVLDNLNPRQLYSELAKRVHVVEPEDGDGEKESKVDDLVPSNGIENIMAMLAGAKQQMKSAADFVHQVNRDNKSGCLQTTHVPYRLPLVTQEAPVIAGAVAAKRDAFLDCESLLRSAADAMRTNSAKDSFYFQELNTLNKKWPLAPGIQTRFGCERAALLAGEMPRIDVTRRDTGKIQVRASAASNLFVNRVAVFRVNLETSSSHGALLRAGYAYKARAMLALLKLSSAENVTCFGENQVQVNSLLFSLAPFETPSSEPATGILVAHVLLMQLLADCHLLAHRSGMPLIGATDKPLLLKSRSALSRVVAVYDHVNLIHDIDALLCEKHRVVWNKTRVTDNVFHSLCFVYPSSIVECCLFGILVTDGILFIDGKQSNLTELRVRVNFS